MCLASLEIWLETWLEVCLLWLGTWFGTWVSTLRLDVGPACLRLDLGLTFVYLGHDLWFDLRLECQHLRRDLPVQELNWDLIKNLRIYLELDFGLATRLVTWVSGLETTHWTYRDFLIWHTLNFTILTWDLTRGLTWNLGLACFDVELKL